MTKEPNDREPKMDGSLMHGVPGDDAWLESLLRADALRLPHIDDNGFSARVMGALPVPRKAVNRWLVPTMAALGGAVAIGLTPAGGYFAAHFLELFDLRHFSLANLDVLVPVVMLYVCSFAAVRER
ncbi:MAG: hypothetical protein JWR16_2064 [Nevskia sp.]|nr:hypothetical protein [Nevskia sp.]